MNTIVISDWAVFGLLILVVVIHIVLGVYIGLTIRFTREKYHKAYRDGNQPDNIKNKP